MQAGDLTGAILDGRYRVIEAIAEGAMGVVYRAERVKLGRIVAIKVMHDELPEELASRQRFEVEAMAMARLEHPHCAAVVDVGVHAGRPFVVMDFVAGDNLKDLLEVRGGFSVVRVIEIMRQVLSGLAHAHELGIVHRDIKPANIVLSQKAGLGDHVKILDFGLARVRDATGPSLTMGMIVGTPSYMAPEQCTGGAIDARTDLYACGVLMYELLTGVRPFTSATDDPVEVVTMHIRRPPPTLADAGGEFGPELEQIVARALAKRPADRFETATAFSAALDVIRARLISGPIALPTAAPPAPPPGAPSIPELAPPIAVAEPVAQAAPLPAPLPTPRPAPSEQPIAWIPLDRRQLKITGIVLGALLVLVVVAIAASSKRSTIEPPVATGSSLVAPTPAGDDIDLGADPAGELLARAQELADAGNPGQALDLLIKGRVNFPTNAPMAYLAGKLYFTRLYWNDGIAAFRTAIRLDPAYKSDAELIKTVLRGFITTPSYNNDLASFLRNDIGVLAEGFLEDTAKNHPVPGIRARAAAELKRYR